MCSTSFGVDRFGDYLYLELRGEWFTNIPGIITAYWRTRPTPLQLSGVNEDIIFRQVRVLDSCAQDLSRLPLLESCMRVNNVLQA